MTSYKLIERDIILLNKLVNDINDLIIDQSNDIDIIDINIDDTKLTSIIAENNLTITINPTLYTKFISIGIVILSLTIYLLI